MRLRNDTLLIAGTMNLCVCVWSGRVCVCVEWGVCVWRVCGVGVCVWSVCGVGMCVCVWNGVCVWSGVVCECVWSVCVWSGVGYTRCFLKFRFLTCIVVFTSS